jgi:hypothetical protein
MADSKITALTALTAADPANDMIPIVDVSDTPPASGNTKRISINNILACSPTATLASATITGDLTVDTNVLKVDTSNNRVGIGTASPTVALEVAGSATITGNLTVDSNTLVVTASTDTVCIGATTTDAKFRVLDGSGNGVRIGFSPGVLNYNLYDATVHEFRAVGGTNSFGAITANGIGLGLTPAASGIGVAFPATQSASSNANTLDDYEEGTWTGTLKGSVSDPTTPVTATGIYTKVGKLVTITIAYSNVNTTGASGDVTITGLPFAGAATGAGSVITFDMFTTSTTLACWNVGTTIAFYVSGGFIPATHNAGASRNVNVTMTYFV